MGAFPGFFLTTLGPAFLRTMYKAFLLNEGGIFVVCELNGQIYGFAVGILKSAGRDRKLASQFLLEFLCALVPAVVRNPITVIKRIASRCFEIGEETNVPEGAVVLRSIGVVPDHRGSGVAGRVLQYFELQASLRGATSVALTTDAVNNERTINFYRKHDYTIAQEFKRDEVRAMYLMIKKLHQPL
jgi:ribosomal protein S18 acetylase RimI-like enzyme